MTVKSIIDVEVDDAAFKNFSALYEKYKASLAEMPGAWKAVNAEVGGVSATFETIVAAMVAQQIISKQIADAEKERAKTEEKSRREKEASERSGVLHWRDMARSTKDVARNIVGATESLLKWTGITAAISGLVGAGGLYGIDRMAAGVASDSRSSRGLGLTYGEQKAFGVNFGQVVDPDAFLGSVNQQLHSTNKAALFGAGLTASEMKGDTATVGVNLLEHLKKIADTTDPAMLANVMQANGLDQVTTLEDMMRLRAMTPQQFSDRKAQFGKDATALNVGDDTQNLWADFTRQMSRAGTELENVFVKGLVKLEKPLEHLSDSFVHLIEKLGDEDGLGKWIDIIAAGLNKFADYIGTAEFQEKVNKFAVGVGDLADAVVAAYHTISELTGDIAGHKRPDGSERPWWSKVLHPIPTDAAGDKPIVVGPAPSGNTWLDFPKPAWLQPPAPAETPAAAPSASPVTSAAKGWLDEQFAFVEKIRKLPEGLLSSVAFAESTYNPNAVNVDSKGRVYRGLFQFRDDTAKDNGVNDAFDPSQATAGAGRYLERLLKEFKGDVAKAVAAYNWGDGNVRKDVAAHGDDWQKFIPRETANEIAKVLGRMSGTSKTSVTIHNNTGGSAVVSTAQVAG